MGDRANVAIPLRVYGRTYAEDEEPAALNIYSHWGGFELPRTVQSALLAARPRWSDPSYAVRIFVDQVTKDGRDQETGFGLSLVPDFPDNDGYPLLVVDFDQRHVRVIAFEELARKGILTSGPCRQEFSFEDYLKLDLSADPWNVLDAQTPHDLIR